MTTFDIGFAKCMTAYDLHAAKAASIREKCRLIIKEAEELEAANEYRTCPYCSNGCMDCLGLSERDFM